MGKELAPIVAARLGRTLLELGGNNAAIVCPSADIDLAIKLSLFLQPAHLVNAALLYEKAFCA